MRIKKARQLLKSLADDTRLRIINLLKEKALTVSELCLILGKEQSNISKHLARLRLTEIVSDRREGNNVVYTLGKPTNNAHKELLNAIVRGLSDIETFKKDNKKLAGLKKERKKGGEK